MPEMTELERLRMQVNALIKRCAAKDEEFATERAAWKRTRAKDQAEIKALKSARDLHAKNIRLLRGELDCTQMLEKIALQAEEIEQLRRKLDTVETIVAQQMNSQSTTPARIRRVA